MAQGPRKEGFMQKIIAGGLFLILDGLVVIAEHRVLILVVVMSLIAFGLGALSVLLSI